MIRCRQLIQLPVLVAFAMMHVFCLCRTSTAAVPDGHGGVIIRSCCSAIRVNSGQPVRSTPGSQECPNCIAMTHVLNDSAHVAIDVPHLHLDPLAFVPSLELLASALTDGNSQPSASLTTPAGPPHDLLQQTCALLI